MATCYNMIPGTWPSLGVPETVLQLFEPSSAVAPTQLDSPQPTAPDVDMVDLQDSDTTPAAGGFISLTVTQHQAEATRLERLLADLDSSGGFQAMKDQVKQTLMGIKKELGTRKGPGQQLDSALAKLKTCQQSKSLAEKHLNATEKALAAAKEAVQKSYSSRRGRQRGSTAAYVSRMSMLPISPPL